MIDSKRRKQITSSHSCISQPTLERLLKLINPHRGGGVVINLRRSHTQATSAHDADWVGMPRAGLVAPCSRWPAFCSLLFRLPFLIRSRGYVFPTLQPQRRTHTSCPYRKCRWSPVGAEGGAGDQSGFREKRVIARGTRLVGHTCMGGYLHTRRMPFSLKRK